MRSAALCASGALLRRPAHRPPSRASASWPTPRDSRSAACETRCPPRAGRLLSQLDRRHEELDLLAEAPASLLALSSSCGGAATCAGSASLGCARGSSAAGGTACTARAASASKPGRARTCASTCAAVACAASLSKTKGFTSLRSAAEVPTVTHEDLKLSLHLTPSTTTGSDAAAMTTASLP